MKNNLIYLIYWIPFLLIGFTIGVPQILCGQTLDSPEIQVLEKRLDSLNQIKIKIGEQLETQKLGALLKALETTGIPSGPASLAIVKHVAMIFGYDESQEQAQWVAHIIHPDVSKGGVSRTNDFREDSLVTTGTAQKADYWNSGYDRGHLAPSADFRWSRKALSESYYYSNMSPQKPELNRESWAMLEDKLRYHVIATGHPIFVVTGPVITPGLPRIGPSQVSVPVYYYKVALDLQTVPPQAIGFVMVNGKNEYPTFSYAVTLDSVEKLTHLDFFPALEDKMEAEVESRFNAEYWKSEKEKGETEPIPALSLPKGKFNTVQAKYQIGAKATICGTVVDAKYVEKSGNTFMNLDRRFPNDIFSISVWKTDRVNFSYEPEKLLLNKQICVTGMVRDNNGKASMSISNEKAISLLDGSSPQVKSESKSEEEDGDEGDAPNEK
jgi:endonuclease G